MKNEILIPFIIAGLTAAFFAVSLMVYLSGGKASLINKKLKLGALLLTFTGFVNSGFGQEDIGDTCYMGFQERLNSTFIGANAGCVLSNFDQMKYNRKGLYNELYPDSIISLGYYFGYFFEYFISENINTHSSLSIRLDFTSMPSHYSEIANINIENVSPFVPVVYEADYDLSYINLDILFNYTFAKGFGFGFGSSVNINTSHNSNEYLKILSEDPLVVFPESTDYKLKAEQKTLILNEGNIPNYILFDLSIKFIVNYEFKLDKNFFILPEVGYCYKLTKQLPESKWLSLNSLIGLAIRYRI